MSKTKDIKFELGPQLSSLFYNTWDEKSKGCEAVITSAMKQVQQTRNLTSDELKIEFSNLVQRVFEKIGNEVVNDNRITSAFLGKEELLDKAISFTKKQVPELLNDYNEFAQV